MSRLKSLFSLITLVLAVPLFAADNPAASIAVDAAAQQRPIDPRIYGVAFATPQELQDLNVPLNRWGGNNTSRYNWQQNADNRGFDWYFESIGYGSATAGAEADSFIANSKSAGAEPMMTIPTIGWVAKLGANRSKLASFSIAKYGAQTDRDWQWFADAGNGVSSATGQNITNNDPNDANVLADSLFMKSWASHLVTQWGGAANGGLRYYILDNEPSIWFSTHHDVAPVGRTMEQVRDSILDYGARVKEADPNAVVVAPEEWGWSGYIFSGYDQQWGAKNGWSNLPDRTAHGGADYLPWLLSQLKANEQSTGRRILDIFSVHYYPQGGEYSNDTTSTMQLRRNRSTRSLWDPNYVDESWIADKVQLVPRLRSWTSQYYPGTKVAVTEYNWGAENHMNGATTQADILGIFGREGLDAAALWTTPDATTPLYKAIKLYRNYDGNKSSFGDVSVAAGGPNPDNVAVFASKRSSDGALTIMVVNKYLANNTPVSINLANFAAGAAAQRWQLAANVLARQSDVALSGTTLTASLPAQSVTLFVIPASNGTPANQSPVASISSNVTSGTAPLAVSFSGAGSTDADGSIVSYQWNFGNGVTASGVSASTTYNAAGTYTATLTVTDNNGATATASRTITVAAAPAPLNAPTSLTAGASRATVTLKWRDNAANESGYYVERAAAGGAFVRIAQLGANAKSYSDAPGKGTWVYRVQAFDATCVSAYTNTAQVGVK
ncbi:MAG: PKD domain-containing protein [Acidobacteriota bacterium]|nr:PKD domain-containing protein [Acidobacteriota bacterium]